MSDCIFCDILAGKSPASIAYQDEVTIAFMDIYALNPGQVVVIPRKHVTCMADMDEATGMQLFKAAMRVCRAIRKAGVECDGINVLLADGEAAGQEVFHVHFLVIPRLKGDSMRITANWTKPDRDELDEIAEKIRLAGESL